MVADNLDQATRIAYGQTRNRVVTLKGETIEVTGTMSGGGQPQKGRMGSKITEEFTSEQIKKMEDKLKIDQESLKEMQSRKQELEPRAYDLKHKIDKAKNDLVKLKNEISSLKDQVKEYKKIEASCVQKVKEINRDEAKQKNLENILEKFKSEFEKADQAAAKLRDENDELHAKIIEISQNILDEPKARLKNLETKIGEKNSEITKLTLEIKTCKRNLINSEKKLNSLKEDLELNETNLEKFKNRLENMDENGKELVEKHEQIKKEIEELESDIKQVSKVIKQNENKIQKLEEERIDLKHKMEKSNEQLCSEEKECKRFENAIATLKLHNIKDIEKNVFTNDESSLQEGPELEKFDQDFFTGFDIENAARTVRKLEENLKSLNPNLTAIQNYKELVKN